MYNQIILPKGEYLKKVLPKLPSNKIIYKHITGCGATHLELISNRWSILIEPYIPVIIGKSNEQIFAVYGNVTSDDIVDYLSVKRDKYKLVSTPEGLRKIIDACTELKINIYTKFFLLVDECEKLVQDVDFRPGIIYVISHFFKFKNKSFISATPIPPSDPRFQEHNIENFNIYPQVKEMIPIDLYTTNNLASTLYNYFKTNQAEHYIIFINSTDRIASIIDFFKIKDKSSVFCARESVDKLKAIDKGEIAFENWDKEKLKKFNFFTSRFFTAFDMILDVKPNVLILSDVKTARHSALDPNTDIIQIIGRARNGVNHIAHISNWEGSLISKTEEVIRGFLEGSNQAYYTIKNLRDVANQSGAYQAYDEALKLISFSRFIDEYTDSISHFMIDNEIHANVVNGYYKSSTNLEKAYIDTDRFQVNHIKERYKLDDIKELGKGLSEKKIMQYVCEIFHKHFEEKADMPYTLYVNHELNKFISTHDLKYRYYSELGIEKIRELEYNPMKISNYYDKIQIEKSPGFLQLQLSLMLIFKGGRTFSTQKINTILSHLFSKHNVILRPTLAQLREWFEVRRTTVGYTEEGTEIKKYEIIKPLNSLELPRNFRH